MISKSEGKDVYKWLSKTLTVLLGSITLMAGCGGGDGTNDQGASVQQIEAVCQSANKKAASEIPKAYNTAKAKGIRTERETMQFEVDTLVPILVADAETQLEGIRSLDVQSDDEAQVKAILDAYETWIERAKKTPTKVVATNDIFQDGRELAGKYGFIKCGLNPFEASNN